MEEHVCKWAGQLYAANLNLADMILIRCLSVRLPELILLSHSHFAEASDLGVWTGGGGV